MRVHPRRPPLEELRLQIGRLSGLPLRPLTARTVTGVLPAEVNPDEIDSILTRKTRGICQLDPGWVLAHAASINRFDPLLVIAETPWWPAHASEPSVEFMVRLWRHSIAVGLAAGSLAREADDPDPDSVARAGLLSRLGCWAVVAAEPEWMAEWWHEPTPIARRQREMAAFGTDLADLGRRMAERLGCDPLVIDAAWLHDAHGPALQGAANDPVRLAYIQKASLWAEQTPWSMGRVRLPELAPPTPRLRILIAEVQARTAGVFVAADASPHEERMTRQNARLRLLLATTRQERDAGLQFLRSLSECDPAASPEDWAARAAQSWCALPGVSAARVDWLDSGAAALNENSKAKPLAESADAAPGAAGMRPAALVLPLKARGKTRATIRLWSDQAGTNWEPPVAGSLPHLAWQSWAAMVVDRAVSERRVQKIVGSVREHSETEEERLDARNREALGEFAGGAGHELNNPLAVIVGRAQLLLARTNDPETMRSLRIILSQAGRAHRILRDLMFVARPPAPALRNCRPADLLNGCVRDVQEECAARGIRVSSEVDATAPVGHFDPDGLRHLAEILLRNAVQATPSGGKIVIRAKVQGDELSWSFNDSGAGISAHEAAHLFDPFFCGRQAGRGLGLGLARAARIVDQAGGRLRWSSSPGHGSVFQVHLPLSGRGLAAEPAAPTSTIAAAAGERI